VVQQFIDWLADGVLLLDPMRRVGRLSGSARAMLADACFELRAGKIEFSTAAANRLLRDAIGAALGVAEDGAVDAGGRDFIAARGPDAPPLTPVPPPP
jgi:hypothetical protein